MRKFAPMFAGLLLIALGAGAPAQDAPAASTPFRARCDHVFDGDSLRLADRREVRLLGIDAPERDEPFANEARDRLRALLGEGEMLVVPAGDLADRFGRILAFLHAPAPAGGAPTPEGSVNFRLVREGLARAYDAGEEEDAPWRSALQEAQREARAAHRGLWSRESAADEPYYVGSTRKFHRPSCPHVASIDRPRRFETRDACYEAGLGPCRECKP